MGVPDVSTMLRMEVLRKTSCSKGFISGFLNMTWVYSDVARVMAHYDQEFPVGICGLFPVPIFDQFVHLFRLICPIITLNKIIRFDLSKNRGVIYKFTLTLRFCMANPKMRLSN